MLPKDDGGDRMAVLKSRLCRNTVDYLFCAEILQDLGCRNYDIEHTVWCPARKHTQIWSCIKIALRHEKGGLKPVRHTTRPF